MRRLVILLIPLLFLVACGAPSTPTPTSVPTPLPLEEKIIELGWYGHSTFTIKSPEGLLILTDPCGPDTGYTPPPPDIDLVTVSHNHFDHNQVQLVKGEPITLYGVTDSQVAKIDQTFRDVRVRTVATFHDESQGSQRGPNGLFLFEVAGMRLAHLGDLGHILTEEQVTQIGPVDILLIPVGGVSTIDAQKATTVAEQLSAKLIFPMHYRTPDLKFELASVNAFLEGKTVERLDTNSITIAKETLPERPKVIVLNYK